MPTREKQDNQDDDPNNQRQSRERYREHKEPAADRHWIQQATEVEAENHAWSHSIKGAAKKLGPSGIAPVRGIGSPPSTRELGPRRSSSRGLFFFMQPAPGRAVICLGTEQRLDFNVTHYCRMRNAGSLLRMVRCTDAGRRGPEIPSSESKGLEEACS